MKRNLSGLIFLCCTLLLTAGCTTGGCQRNAGCSTPVSFPSCQCSDPSCADHSCISGRTCCSVYGNIGEIRNDVSQNWDGTYALTTSSFSDNYNTTTTYYK